VRDDLKIKTHVDRLHGTWDPMKGDDTRAEKAWAWDGDARVVPYDILGSGLQVQDSWAWGGDEEA
jgi:hypothetical protein